MMTMNTSGPGLGALSVSSMPTLGALSVRDVPTLGALSVSNMPTLGAAALSDAQISAIATQTVRDALSRDALVALFKLYNKNTQGKLAAAMIAAGGNADKVGEALKLARGGFLGPYKEYAWAWGLLSTASGAVSAYHGYKRNESVGWALAWFVLGSFFPIVTPVIAVAQGYGKPK